MFAKMPLLVLLVLPLLAGPAAGLLTPPLRLLAADAESPAADTVRFEFATNEACGSETDRIELLLHFRVAGELRTAREPVPSCPNVALVVERALQLGQSAPSVLVVLELAQLLHDRGTGRFPFSELRPDGPHDSFPNVATVVYSVPDGWPRFTYGLFLVGFAVLIALRARMTDPLRAVLAPKNTNFTATAAAREPGERKGA